MKNCYLLPCFLLLCSFELTWSQVGVGTTTPASTLEVVATNPTGASTNVDGILIPRVSRQRAQNMAGTPTSTLIYVNDIASGTATGTTINVTSVGFYFFNTSGVWERISTGLNTNWSLTGNATTNPATNFIGTTDAQDLRIRTNNTNRWNISNTNNGQLQSYSLGTAALPIYSWQSDPNTGMFSSVADNLNFSTNGVQRISIGNTGNVGINIAPSTYKLDVDSGTGDAVYGHSANVGGILGRETNFSIGTPPQAISGAGVYANNPAAGLYQYFCTVYRSGNSGKANINYSNVWMASYNYVDNASATVNPSSSYHQLNVTSPTLGGFQSAINAYSDRGTTVGNPGYTIGVNATADAQNQDAIGVSGVAFTNAGFRFGGYFEGLSYAGVSNAYAYVGGTPNGVTARKILGTGSVSEIIPTANHGRVTLTCPESPEYWYQDYGTVEMVNGKATIVLDPILAEIIVVNDENPIRVFVLR
ncbi:hypothetical protein H9X57_09830 [Flavobacterium piscinae]|uniref:hypothetical protein n=1 Tax=Flavobacterium piscinae TaxID=2506424 RepID=UPI0019CA363F|nr:hypothetical protein [Flavobacterium piscinae]MBC8883567.1 hypothetical protein [Flavobacterium piscinae]